MKRVTRIIIHRFILLSILYKLLKEGLINCLVFNVMIVRILFYHVFQSHKTDSVIIKLVGTVFLLLVSSQT